MIRWPTTRAKTTSAPSFSVVTARTCQTLSDCSLPPTMAGKSTSRRMVKRSSTTSQPRATWPVVVCSALLSERTRVRTTVLATEMAMPKTAPAAHDQPKPCETTMPSKVAAPIWAAAPGRTIRWTASRSLRWKWRPTPNMSRMMPISAHWEAVSASATKPGE